LARLQHTSEQLNRRRFASGAYARKILNKKIPQDLADIVRYELNGPDGELAAASRRPRFARARHASRRFVASASGQCQL
jgi:hypothetical protein